MNVTDGRLLLVIPPVVLRVGNRVEVDGDFGNNLRGYLKNFEHVTFACPVLPTAVYSGLVNTIPLENIDQSQRISFVPLPYTYREDRHILHYLSTRKLLRSEIEKADYLIFSPHAIFDWSTLAAKLSIALDRSYDMEGDWHLENVSTSRLSKMSWGFKKLRKYLWLKHYTPVYYRCLRHSSVALLQGQDVFEAYRDIAPNPQKVLNVQITPESIISVQQLNHKIRDVLAGKPLIITYAGRANDMKGPMDWLATIGVLVKKGIKLNATWFGDGELLSDMRRLIASLQLEEFVTLAGMVNRETVMSKQRDSHIFMFCHKTAESPRNLVEALACGCPIIGYGGTYARDLVGQCGGGAFVPLDDWKALAELVENLSLNRRRLVALMLGAKETSHLYDRDKAIQYRIDLIRKYVKPARASQRSGDFDRLIN